MCGVMWDLSFSRFSVFLSAAPNGNVKNTKKIK